MRDLHLYTTDFDAAKTELADMQLCRQNEDGAVVDSDNSWLKTQVTTTPQQGHFRLRTPKARAQCIEQAFTEGLFSVTQVIDWPIITGQELYDKEITKKRAELQAKIDQATSELLSFIPLTWSEDLEMTEEQVNEHNL